MLKSSRALLALLCPLLLNACAKEETHDAFNTYPIYQYEEEGLTLFSVLKKAPLSYGAGGLPKSAESVGMMAMAASPVNSVLFSIGQCTGWLIERNVVATNSHCITEEIAKARDCGPTLAIKFPSRDSRGIDTYACKKLLRKSDISGQALIKPDWAFFEISADEREPLRISRSGIADEMPLRSLRIDPTGGGSLGGSFSEANCKAVQNSVLNNKFNHDYAPTGVALGCTVMQGNSGSPIFNSLTGEVVGIAQAFLTKNFMTGANEEMKEFGLRYPSTPPPHVIFTNLACVEDARTGMRNNQTLCEAKGPSLLDKALKQDSAASAGAALDRESTAWENSLPTFALYRYGLTLDPIVARATPFCLKPMESWPAKILDTLVTDGYVFRTKTYRVSFDSELSLKPILTLDPDLRISSKIEMEASKKQRALRITFSGEGGKVEAADESLYGSQSDLEELHWCSAEELAKGHIAPTLPR
ncbi:MAG: trypsin-like serine protease [Proteobacteria bacterium]|nr:MAG: trypsin-like serine protease [Pseudomonadota bacterium]